MKQSVFAIFFFSVLGNAGAAERFVEREMPFGKYIDLQEFGGPKISVAVTARQMSYVTATIADYTQLLPVARTNIQGVTVNDYRGTASVYGTSQVIMQPTKISRRIEKENGISLPGIRSQLYLLYQEPTSGIRVFFHDAVCAQNHDALVITVPIAPPPPTPPTPPTISAANEPAKQGGDGIVSSELLARYLKLQAARQTLDVSNAAAVARFNDEAAQYQDALHKARAAMRRQ